jgi:hypothetical protein
MSRTRKSRAEAHPPGVAASAVVLVITTLAFAVLFPLAASVAGVDTATISAVLAAVPGILLAVLGRRGRRR